MKWKHVMAPTADKEVGLRGTGLPTATLPACHQQGPGSLCAGTTHLGRRPASCFAPQGLHNWHADPSSQFAWNNKCDHRWWAEVLQGSRIWTLRLSSPVPCPSTCPAVSLHLLPVAPASGCPKVYPFTTSHSSAQEQSLAPTIHSRGFYTLRFPALIKRN